MKQKLYHIIFLALLLVFSSKAFAQISNSKIEERVETTDSIPLLVDPDAPNVFWGKVFDNNIIEPMVGVQLLIKDTRIGTFTDINGLFYLAIPDNIMRQDSLYVIMKSNGFNQNTIQISTNDIPKNKDYFMTSSTDKVKLRIKRESPYTDPIYIKKK